MGEETASWRFLLFPPTNTPTRPTQPQTPTPTRRIDGPGLRRESPLGPASSSSTSNAAASWLTESQVVDAPDDPAAAAVVRKRLLLGGLAVVATAAFAQCADRRAQDFASCKATLHVRDPHRGRPARAGAGGGGGGRCEVERAGDAACGFGGGSTQPAREPESGGSTRRHRGRARKGIRPGPGTRWNTSPKSITTPTLSRSAASACAAARAKNSLPTFRRPPRARRSRPSTSCWPWSPQTRWRRRPRG